MQVSDDTKALSRGIGGGIGGLTCACLLASQSSSKEAKDIVLKAMLTSFTLWGINNVLRCSSKSSNQSKVDLAVTGGLAGVALAGLGN